MLLFSSLHAQTDSLRNQLDSAFIMEADPTDYFFQHNGKIASPAATRLITRENKNVSLSDFLKNAGIFSKHALADLDKDGKKELVVSNYTGGAHCCDEIYVFRNLAPNRYQHAAKFFAGHTEITLNKEFIFSFHEQLGYFFTCYACQYSDTTDEAPIAVRQVMLKYNKGKMIIVPGDKELRSTLLDNLGKLSEQPYEKLSDPASFDNGLRKEFAMNLAVFYYSFGKNIIETQKLFNRVYKFPDAKNVWTAFVKQLQNLKKVNDF